MRTRRLILIALVTAALQPISGLPALAADRPTGPLSLATGSYLGAFENHDRADGTPGSQAEVLALESAMGRSIDIDNRFYGFNEQIPSALEVWDIANGRIPLVTWGAGTDTIQLANGTHDPWLRAQARRMRDLGAPVFLRFYHEPDDRSMSVIHSSAQFIAAWRHVHDIFEQEGASNVVWVWCPTAWTFISDPNRVISLYPGDSWVDWIAADGYSWYPGRPNSRWRSFEEIFDPFYDWAITMNKPIMFAEIGVQEDPAQPGRKAAWLANAHEVLETNYDQVQAAVYFDTTIMKGGNTFVWNLRSSQGAFDSWRAMGQDPYFNPGSTTPDTEAPDVPGTPSGSSNAPGQISISWAASDDDIATSITYRVYRDGDLGTPVGTVVSSSTTTVPFTDTGLDPSSPHTYQVTASDGTNTSGPSTASEVITVQAGPAAIFTEPFANLAAWNPVTRITLDNGAGAAAPPAAHAQVTNQSAFARRTLGGGFLNVCLSSAVRLNSIGSGANVQLLKLRAGSTNVARLVVTPGRALRVRNDVTGAFLSNGPPLPIGWHTLELCTTVGAGTGSLRVSLDGTLVTTVANQNLGTVALTGVQIGDDTAKTFNADWDDVVARG